MWDELKSISSVEHENTSSSPSRCLLWWLDGYGIGSCGVVNFVGVKICGWLNSFIKGYLGLLFSFLPWLHSNCPTSNWPPNKSKPQEFPQWIHMHRSMLKLFGMLEINLCMVGYVHKWRCSYTYCRRWGRPSMFSSTTYVNSIVPCFKSK